VQTATAAHQVVQVDTVDLVQNHGTWFESSETNRE